MILVPRQGIKPTSPALQGRLLTTGPPGKSQNVTLFYAQMAFHCVNGLHSVGCFHSSTDGRLGCIYLLAVMTSAAVDTRVCEEMSALLLTNLL